MRLYYEKQIIVPTYLVLFMVILTAGFLLWTSLEVMSNGFSTMAIIWLIVTVSMLLSMLVFFLKIKTEVTYDCLKVCILKGRTVPIGNIQSVVTEEFSALKDYGRYGLTIGRKGHAYIAANTNKGLRINLTNGKSLFVSSKRTFEFQNAINAALKARKC